MTSQQPDLVAKYQNAMAWVRNVVFIIITPLLPWMTVAALKEGYVDHHTPEIIAGIILAFFTLILWLGWVLLLLSWILRRPISGWGLHADAHRRNNNTV